MADTGREELPRSPEKVMYISTPRSPTEYRPRGVADTEKDPGCHRTPPATGPRSPRAMEKSAFNPGDQPPTPGMRSPSHDGHSQRHSDPPPSKRGSHVIGSVYRIGAGPGHCSSAGSPTQHRTVAHMTIPDDDGDGEADEQANARLAPKAVSLLLFFLLLIPLLSLLVALWTVLVTAALALVHPLRLVFTRRRTFPDVLLWALAPALNLHLRCARCVPVAAADMHPARAVIVLVCTAPLAGVLALWAGVLAVYWLFAAVVGDPDGLDGRSDGRELVLTTRKKWVGWLRVGVGQG